MQADSHPCNEMAGVDDIQDADQMMQHALPTQFKKKEVPFPVNLTGRNLGFLSDAPKIFTVTKKSTLEEAHLPNYGSGAGAEIIPLPGRGRAASAHKTNSAIFDGGPKPQNNLNGHRRQLISTKFGSTTARCAPATYFSKGVPKRRVVDQGVDYVGVDQKTKRTKVTDKKASSAAEPIDLSVDSDDEPSGRGRASNLAQAGIDRRRDNEARDVRRPGGSSSTSTSSLGNATSKYFHKISSPAGTEEHIKKDAEVALVDTPSKSDASYSSNNYSVSQLNEKNCPSRWSTTAKGESSGKWTNSKQLSVKKPKSIALPLRYFQRGVHMEHAPSSGDDSEESPLSLVLTKQTVAGSTLSTLQAYLRGNQIPSKNDNNYNLDVDLSKVASAATHADNPTLFSLKMNQDTHRHASDTFVMFEMKDKASAIKVKEFLRPVCGIHEREKEYFNNFANDLRDWQKRHKPYGLPLVREAERARNPQALDATVRESTQKKVQGEAVNLARQLERNNRRATRLVVQKNPSVVISPRRNERNNPDGSPDLKSRVKRSRSLGREEDNDRPRRTPRIAKEEDPKLELPNPPWKRPLLYPFEGPKRENVDYDDLKRLNPAELLNDNLINFFLRYMEQRLQENNPTLARETHFLNTFFYERLTAKDDKGKRNIGRVLRWTAKIDLFQKNYVIVPINEQTHWYVAIICNLQHIDRKLDKGSPEQGAGAPDGEDSDATMAEESKKPGQASNSGLEEAITDVVRDKSGDRTENDPQVVETQKSVENMSIDADFHETHDPTEWPADKDELEGVDLLKRKPKTEMKINCVHIDDDDSIAVNDQTTRSSKSISKGKKKTDQGSGSKLKKQRNLPPDTPVIVILDSMSFGQRAGTMKNLRQWLTLEAKKKRGIDIDASKAFNATYAKVPSQNNWYDCGVYVLWYVQKFLEDPARYVKAFLGRQDTEFDESLWPSEGCRNMRKAIFDKIVSLHEEYEAYEQMRENKAKSGQSEPFRADAPEDKKGDDTSQTVPEEVRIEITRTNMSETEDKPTAQPPINQKIFYWNGTASFKKGSGSRDASSTPKPVAEAGASLSPYRSPLEKTLDEDEDLQKSMQGSAMSSPIASSLGGAARQTPGVEKRGKHARRRRTVELDDSGAGLIASADVELAQETPEPPSLIKYWRIGSTEL